MEDNTKEPETLEQKLQTAIEDLMRKNKVKFSVFLKALRPDIPEIPEIPEIPDDEDSEKKKKQRLNIHKAEYLKHLRASYSVIEIKNMLDVLGYDLKFTVKDIVLEPDWSILPADMKIKYTELMAVCKALGIDIDWVERVDRA